MAMKIELASAAWLEALATAMNRRLCGASLHGAQYLLIETFMNAPAHLADAPDGSVSWHAWIGPNRVRVGRGVPDAAPDRHTTLPYETALIVARLIYADDPSAGGVRDQLVRAATDAGVLKRHVSRPLPADILNGLTRVHDDMARVTL